MLPVSRAESDSEEQDIENALAYVQMYHMLKQNISTHLSQRPRYKVERHPNQSIQTLPGKTSRKLERPPLREPSVWVSNKDVPLHSWQNQTQLRLEDFIETLEEHNDKYFIYKAESHHLHNLPSIDIVSQKTDNTRNEGLLQNLQQILDGLQLKDQAEDATGYSHLAYRTPRNDCSQIRQEKVVQTPEAPNDDQYIERTVVQYPKQEVYKQQVKEEGTPFFHKTPSLMSQQTINRTEENIRLKSHSNKYCRNIIQYKNSLSPSSISLNKSEY